MDYLFNELWGSHPKYLFSFTDVLYYSKRVKFLEHYFACNKNAVISYLIHLSVAGVVSPHSAITPQASGSQVGQDYYSTFHRTRNRKKFTKKEWDDFTNESTRQAMAGLAASPEFTDWIIEHADRIKLRPSESSDETMGSESDSTEVGSGNGFRLFNW